MKHENILSIIAQNKLDALIMFSLHILPWQTDHDILNGKYQ